MLLGALLLAVTVDGTVCRMNRAVDRMIVASDAGARLRVEVGRVPIRFNRQSYDRQDLRPGDRIHLEAKRSAEHLVASAIDVTMRVDDALVDSIFRSHRVVVGRYGAREGKTDQFSLHLPHDRAVRVDARPAFGAKGAAWFRSVKSGDLLEIRGDWPSKELLRASSVTVITDREPSFCTTRARRDEVEMETASREAREQAFLEKNEGRE